jgi:hypothetical protein
VVQAAGLPGARLQHLAGGLESVAAHQAHQLVALLGRAQTYVGAQGRDVVEIGRGMAAAPSGLPALAKVGYAWLSV